MPCLGFYLSTVGKSTEKRICSTRQIWINLLRCRETLVTVVKFLKGLMWLFLVRLLQVATLLHWFKVRACINIYDHLKWLPCAPAQTPQDFVLSSFIYISTILQPFALCQVISIYAEITNESILYVEYYSTEEWIVIIMQSLKYLHVGIKSTFKSSKI